MPEPGHVRRISNYRRRRPLPAIMLIVALGLVATVVWIRTIDSAESRADVNCGEPTPATASLPGTAPGAGPAAGGDPAAGTDPAAQQPEQPPPTLGEVLPANALDEVDPLPPDAVKVRVLNASGKRGQATLVADVLTSDLGFAKAAEPADDPVYANYGLHCHGQIRFGEAGAAAGRTLSIVMPCAELVRDGRQDDTVDFAVGTMFDSLKPSPEAVSVLQQLTELAAPPAADPGGGQQAAPASIDPTQIASIRSAAYC